MNYFLRISITVLFLYLLSSCQTDRINNFPIDKKNLAVHTVHTNTSFAPSINEKEAAFIKAYHSHLEQTIRETAVPGMAYCIVNDNRVISIRGIGVKDIKAKEKIDHHTKFRIGSLSKSVTASLVAILVSQGYISWDTKVIDILPQFQLEDKNQTENITIAHLLSHSTGLPYHAYTNLIESGLKMEEIIPYFKKVKLIEEEGKLCAYQNAAFSVIELVLEKRLDSSIDTIFQDYLFNPVGMCDASVDRENLINANHAKPHRVTRSKKVSTRNVNSKYYNAIPCGGINASISDMARLLQLAMGNFPEIVEDTSLSFMTSPYVPTPGTRYFDRWSKEDSHYGMGWRILNYKGHKLAYHGGFVNNYRSEMAIDLKNNIAICLLFNANSSYAKNAVPTFFDLWDTYENAKN